MESDSEDTNSLLASIPLDVDDAELDDELKTLKYHLLGPSLTKAGQDAVDQDKVRVVKN